MLKKLVPIYSFRQFTGDAFGGVIAALIALPYGLAMATLMGLPPVLGIFTSILTAPITAILGRNPMLIGGTASATVPFIALAVKGQGIGGAAKVSIVAAVFMMAFCVMRLGRHISKVPHPVVSGFSCGIGAMMVISQLKTIFGIASPIDMASSNTIFQLIQVVERVGESRWAPAIIAFVVIGAAFAVARYAPKFPAPLIGVLLAVLVAKLLGLHEKEVGTLQLTLPDFAGFSWTRSDVFTVLPSALALAFVSSVNILITSRVVEHFRGRHRPMRPTDADSELGAYGIANVCAGMFGAPMSVGIPARSLAAVRCGATTRMANILHGIFLILLLEVGAGFVAHIPIPALAAVTAYIGICLLDWGTWHRLRKMRKVDAAAFFSTAVAVLAVNAVAAVVIGCSMYAVQKIYVRLSAPSMNPLPQASLEATTK
jgi:SulP family sulfate permease